MQSAIPKQFLLLGGMPVVARTINTFSEAMPGAEIVVVLPKEDIEMWRNLAARFDVAVHRCVAGGKERFHSVKSGLAALSDGIRTVAVHDAVRPLASKKLIIKLFLEAEKHTAVIPAVMPVDSYRVVDGEESKIIDRSLLRIVQTPQVFNAEALRQAYEQPFSTTFTDDASVMEAAGYSIALVEGERENIKITTPSDILIAEAIITAENETQL